MDSDRLIDAVRIALKAAIGVLPVPVIGTVLGEVISQVIPDLRAVRFQAYVLLMKDRRDRLEAAFVKAQFGEPEVMSLFEERAFQSVRAVSDERREYIANLVANGIGGDVDRAVHSRRLLNILGEVDDGEILVLAFHLDRLNRDPSFWGKHEEVVCPPLSSYRDGPEAMDRDTMRGAADLHLQRLGLLRPDFPVVRPGEVPEFDPETGTVRASFLNLTPLGLLLLREVGIATPDDRT